MLICLGGRAFDMVVRTINGVWGRTLEITPEAREVSAVDCGASDTDPTAIAGTVPVRTTAAGDAARRPGTITSKKNK